MAKYPRKIRITAYLTHGDPICGDPFEINDAVEESEWIDVLRDLKKCMHMKLSVTNGIGVTTSYFINPTFLVAVEVQDID